jgi:hypothetical protein
MPNTTLSKLGDHLAQAIFDDRENLVPPETFSCSDWICKSALQKGIRRNEPEIAIRAAATLFKAAPESVWRRIGIAAFEDVGIGDFQSASLTVAGLAGKRWRAEVGGEWRVASYLIRRLCAATKCRAVDDLFMIAENHLKLAKLRLDMAAGTIADSLALLHRAKTIEERAVAVWSTTAFLRDAQLKRNYRDPFILLEEFTNLGVPAHVLDICAENYKKTREALPLLFPLIWLAKPACGEELDDELPPQRFVNGVPLYSHDRFTREGKEAFRRFLLTDCKSATWIKTNIPRSGQIDLLGLAVFAVEGGEMRKRLRWALADSLRTTWQRDCLSRHCPDGTEILALLRADIEILNDVRASCLAN